MCPKLHLTRLLRSVFAFLFFLLSFGELQAQLTLNFQITSPPCFGVPTGAITASASGGTAPYTYIWSTGASGPTITTLPAGTYSVTVTDLVGNTLSQSATVTQPAQLFITFTGDTCVFPAIVTASGVGGVSPYTYAWNTGHTGPTITINAIGNYCLTITDANGCGAINCVKITAPPINLSLSVTNLTCPGLNTGQVTSTVSGGLPPYNYLWSTGATTPSITNLGVGSYILTVTDARGCSRTATATVIAPVFNIQVSSTNVTTCGANNGTANVIVTQGTPPYTYLWSTGATTASIVNLGPGTYSVTVFDVNNCPATGSAVITAPPPISANITASPFVCVGNTNGTATVNVIGGTLPFSFLWNNGAGTQTIANLPSGNYSVTVTDGAGCQAFASATIQAAQPPTVTITSTPVVCGTGNTGSATAIPAGGTPPYLFAWSNGAATPGITNLTTGNYTVTITDLNGCTATASTTITVFDDLVATISKTDVDCFGANTGSATAMATGGTAPYTFTWSNGAVGSAISGVPAGIYTVTVRDLNGCMTSATVTILQPPLLNVAIAAQNPLVCFGAATGTLTATATGGTPPYDFLWNTGATTPSISNLPAGTYSVTVTDLNGCMAMASFTLQLAPIMEISITGATIVCGQENGGSATVVVIGGTPPFSYEWSTGDTSESIADLGSGSYSVTVTDGNLCTATAEIGILVVDDLTLEVTPRDVLCFGENTGSALAVTNGGTAPYTFVWSNGATTPEISSLFAGTYSVTVTESNGCSLSETITITEPPLLTVSATRVNLLCFDIETGSATATATGGAVPYSYLWSNGETTPQITGLAAGPYSVTVTDINFCTATATVIVSQPPNLNLTINAVQILCHGANSGSATAVATGGTPPYTYMWSNGMTTPTINNLAPGPYTVTVTDINGCDNISGVVITQPMDLVVSITQLQGTCQGAANGILIASATGGTGAVSFQWNGGFSGDIRSNLAAGTYTVTATDANGCIDVASVTITAFPNPVCAITVLEEVIFGNDGALSASATGGTPPYTYDWSNGASTPVITGLNGGIYSVTITDENGCTAVCQVELIARSGLGDFVWEDVNKNGLQDPNEPGVPGIVVRLKNAIGMVIDSTTTDGNGRYSFMGLIPGTYSVQFVVPYPFLFTLRNQGANDAIDSDADSTTMSMTPNVTLAPGEFNPTLDAGIYVRPMIDDSDPCLCLNNSTTETDGQFSELITIFSYPGENWILFNPVGLYLTSSPPPPGIPIPAVGSFPFVEVSPGVYQLAFILLHEQPYGASFTNGVDTLSNANVCRYPSINLINGPPADLCIVADPIVFAGMPSRPGSLTFFINGVQVTSVDPATLGIGLYEFVALFMPLDPNDCETMIRSTFEITENCFAKLGDRAWLDLNSNGLQDSGEPGLPGVKVVLDGVGATAPFRDTTFTDNAGLYMFCVPPGTYKLTFMLPSGADLRPTVQNAGSNDAIDSDPDTVMLMTQIITLAPFQIDLTWDVGFVPPCINLTNPGTIGPGYQYLCGPGNVPAPLVNISFPMGGTPGAPIEYIWMRSVVNGPFDNGHWETIPGTNAPNYSPGPLYQTTYFARCARRDDCGPFLESNVVLVEVGDISVANISGPALICFGESATFFATGTAPGAIISWNFGPAGIPQNAMGSPVTVNFTSFGTFQIALTVTQNGCTATNFKYLTVTTSPVFCDPGIVLDATPLDNGEVLAEWSMLEDQPDFNFTMERSADGVRFEPLDEVIRPEYITGGRKHYVYRDARPKLGRNYYRLRFLGTVFSNVAEVIMYGDSKLVFFYPNPVTDRAVLELFETFNGPVQVDVVAANGVMVQSQVLPREGKQLEMDFSSLPAGVYFLRLRYGELELKRLKIIKL